MPEQFHLSRLQVINWGVFDGYHNIEFSEGGALIAGASGSGKSSLLDAISLGFLPFNRRNFNASGGNSAAVFRPESFTRASLDTLEAVTALDEIFRSSREALYDPAIVALWLRELRAFAELPPEANDDDARRARELFERAQALAYRRVALAVP